MARRAARSCSDLEREKFRNLHLNISGGQAGALEPIHEGGAQRQGGAQRVRAGAQEDGVPALRAQGRRLRRDVRAGLVDHEYHAERDADLPHREAVRAPPAGGDLADGVGERRHLAQRRGDPLEPPLVQRQPVEEGRPLAGLARRLQVRAVRLQDVAAAPADENKLIAERRQKLSELRALGNAFPNDWKRDAQAGDLWVGSRTTRGYGHASGLKVLSCRMSHVEVHGDVRVRRPAEDVPPALVELEGRLAAEFASWRSRAGFEVAPTEVR